MVANHAVVDKGKPSPDERMVIAIIFWVAMCSGTNVPDKRRASPVPKILERSVHLDELAGRQRFLVRDELVAERAAQRFYVRDESRSVSAPVLGGKK